MERNDIQKISSETANIPVYMQSAEYAIEHDELPAYRESFRVNMACRDALESAIHESYHDYCLDTGKAAAQVAAQFGMERVAYVLANTVRAFDHDGRISRDNMNVAGIFSYRRSIPALSICLSLVCARSWQKKKLRRKSAHLCLRKFRKIRRRFRQRPQRKSCRDRSDDHGQKQKCADHLLGIRK